MEHVGAEADVDPDTEMLPPPPAADIDEQPAPRRAAGTRPRAVPIGPRTSVPRAMETEDELGVRDWLSDMGGETEIKVGISRKKPLLGPHGEMISGNLETVEGFIDEDYIRETWGGGEFSLKVYTPKGPNGSYKYFRGRTIKIAGPPKMMGQLLNGATAAAPIAHEDDTLAVRAFDSMAQHARDAQTRADRIEQQAPRGLDIAALQALNNPLHEQLRVAQETIVSLQTQMLTLSQKPAPRDEFRDRLMEKAVEGESVRIEALRAQYENRIDRLKEQHEDHIKRLEDRQVDAITRLENRHQDDIKRLEAVHERDIKNAERVLEYQGKGTEQAFTARLEALKDGKTALERELAAATAKVATLEARKDQTISEKADEILKVKEAIDGLGGGDDAEEKWYEKLIATVGSLPAVSGAIEKLTGGPPPQPGQMQMPQQNQLPPPGIPFSTGDGNVYVRDAAGNVSIVDQNQLRQQRALQQARRKKKVAAQGGEAPDDGGDDDDAEPSGRPPTAQEMRMAVNFMENAIKGGNTTPEQFGQSARNMIPSDVLSYLHHVGIEKFLASARLEAGSPLASIRGKQYARAVAKFLSDGEAEPATPELEQPAEPEAE